MQLLSHDWFDLSLAEHGECCTTPATVIQSLKFAGNREFDCLKFAGNREFGCLKFAGNREMRYFCI